MKLNKIALAGLALGSIAIMTSCDNIDEADRFNKVEKPVTPIEEVTKTLLIQEFTGHKCTNCPRGAEAIHAIQEEYPGQVIAVGLHAASGGPNNTPYPNGQDFNTEEADALYKFFKPDGLPCAVFNGNEKTKSSSYNEWYTLATAEIGKIANMSIKAECEFDAETRNLTVDYTINMTHDISNEKGYGVMVWVMENNIVGYQLDNGEVKTDYVHNHVLRASLNGINGENIGNSFAKGQNIQKSASMILDEKWNAENCQVVVYMFDTESYAVEQSTLADVISEKVVEDPHKVPQTLLIQEFTGHKCTNCPRGAESIHAIQEQYPGQVIAVGLHAASGGPNNTPYPNGQNFNTEEADALYKFFKPDGLPCAVFNGDVDTKSSSYNEWYTLATNAIATETNMTISATSSFDNATREVSVDYSINFTEDVAEDLSVMVWVMENDIIGYQLDNGEVKTDYVHNHVLRASLNGEWGESIGKTFANGQKVKGNAKMTLKEDWIEKNCQIVVYTFNSESKAVRQAAATNISIPLAE